MSEFVAEVAGPHEISSLLHTTGGSKVVIVVNEVPDWLTTPELVTTEPSELVVVQEVVYSEVASGTNVVMVVRKNQID